MHAVVYHADIKNKEVNLCMILLQDEYKNVQIV